ncbi:helix-turn-helix domain-containing protein [Actinobacillus equuli subsp. haemolyticus]|uniref:helix-turn-helix domain-containing protein n=1 Tax=Actinobacillus equuli TaxID=718 RepID=UPI0024184C40|nr:helix-turn-helix domain-containing protein [Actinobacillus equuli]MDG4948453.1 helix-turn-helix domain-containing protein [Actinobacillus equuli subsp. haemolyticus]
MNTKERFNCLISVLGFKTVKDFAENVGISQARLVDVMRERQKIPQDLVVTLLTDFDVNANWLIAGVGEMFIDGKFETTLTPQEQLLLNDYRESNEQGKQAIEQAAKALSAVNKLLQSSKNKTKKQSSSHTEMHISEVKQQNNIQHLEGGITFKEGD